MDRPLNSTGPELLQNRILMSSLKKVLKTMVTAQINYKCELSTKSDAGEVQLMTTKLNVQKVKVILYENELLSAFYQQMQSPKFHL